MEKTSDILIECCYKDLIPPIPVIADYFGIAYRNEEDMCIVLGLYQGLVKFRGVKSDELHEAFLQNKLDELMHSKYRERKSQYYMMFCERNLSLRSWTSPVLFE